MRWVVAVVVLAVLLGGALPAHAVQPDEMLANPQLEARARALSRELRCMVCQNQSIDDSEAPLARDLRILVRDRLKAGDSDQQVLDFLVARYGEFVLLKPRFSWQTALLWLTPVGVLLVGATGLFFAARARRSAAAGNRPVDAPLSEAERARLADLTSAKGMPGG